MINIIFGLVIATIYAFNTENPTSLATIAMGLFAASYLMFFKYALTLYAIMKAIAKRPKLKMEFLAAMREESEN